VSVFENAAYKSGCHKSIETSCSLFHYRRIVAALYLINNRSINESTDSINNETEKKLELASRQPESEFPSDVAAVRCVFIRWAVDRSPSNCPI